MNSINSYFKYLIVFLITLSGYTFSFSQDISFYGVTVLGGEEIDDEDGGGVIFKTDSNCENLSVEFSFIRAKGKHPSEFSQICEYTNNKFYGLTSYAGGDNHGVLYEFDNTTNYYVEKIHFQNDSSGRSPIGGLLKANNGLLFGVTEYGGAYDKGVLFSYNPLSNEFDTVLTFNGEAYGSNPSGGLTLSSTGMLYGLTREGGIENAGVLFEFNPTLNTLNKLIDFDSLNTGINPTGQVIETSDNKILGYTKNGGDNGDGVIFEYSPSLNEIYIKHSFNNLETGKEPVHRLLQASDGNCYGVTNIGGINNMGVLFVYNIESESLNKIIDLNSEIHGEQPCGGLIQVGDSSLYGLTRTGGPDISSETENGVFFEYNFIQNEFNILQVFTNSDPIYRPRGSLLLASNGKLYGGLANSLWGTGSGGGFFEYDLSNNNYQEKVKFSSYTNGASPDGKLLQADNSKLYGIATNGGVFNNGVLYEYDISTDSYAKLLDFEMSFGYGSGLGLMQANNGKIYGIRRNGGDNNKGTLFEYDISSNILTKKIDFDGTEKGTTPGGKLTQAQNGKLYGVTEGGGDFGYGTIFSFDPESDEFTKEVSFNNTNGAYPTGDLIELPNQKMYGITSRRNTYFDGVLFEFDPVTAELAIKVDFEIQTGKPSYGDLALGLNNKLYGVSSNGSYTNPIDYIYEYDVDNNLFENIYSNDDDLLGELITNVIFSSNGLMYGVARRGGENDIGVIFEFDTITNIYTKKVDFNYNNGRWPAVNGIVEIIDIYTCIPQNLIVNEYGNATWDMPSGEICGGASFLGYSIYHDGNYMGFCTETSWQFTNLNLGESYTAGISALYSNGESEILEFNWTYLFESTPVYISPTEQTVMVGDTIYTSVDISDVENLGGFEIEIDFNPSFLQVHSIQLGSFLGSSGRTIFPINENINNSLGLIEYAVTTLGSNPPGPNGEGVLLNIIWVTTENIEEDIETPISIQNIQLIEPDGSLIHSISQDGIVFIEYCYPHDFDCDCDVDIVDVTMAAYTYGTSVGDPNYNPTFDLDSDGDIDIVDITMVTYDYGWTCTGKSMNSINLANTTNNDVELSFKPEDIIANKDGNFQIELYIENAQELGGYELELDFNPENIQITSVEQGNIIQSTDRKIFPLYNNIDNVLGRLNYSIATIGANKNGASESGSLIILNCKALKADFELPTLAKAQLVRIDAAVIDYTFKSDEIEYTNSTETYIVSTYPSPFKNEMTIHYKVGQVGFVSFKMFDVYGKLIKQTASVYLEAGEYTRTFTRDGFSNGIYIYSLVYESKIVSSKRVVVLK